MIKGIYMSWILEQENQNVDKSVYVFSSKYFVNA